MISATCICFREGSEVETRGTQGCSHQIPYFFTVDIPSCPCLVELVMLQWMKRKQYQIITERWLGCIIYSSKLQIIIHSWRYYVSSASLHEAFVRIRHFFNIYMRGFVINTPPQHGSIQEQWTNIQGRIFYVSCEIYTVQNLELDKSLISSREYYLNSPITLHKITLQKLSSTQLKSKVMLH